MEFDAWPKLDRHLLAVGRGFVGQRQLRHDVELFVDVKQLVAESGEDNAANIGAGDAGIEDIRIFGEPDAERSLGPNACSERHRECRGQNCQTYDSHRSQPLFPLAMPGLS